MNAAIRNRSGGIWGDGETKGLFLQAYVWSGLYYRDWLRYLDIMESLMRADDVNEQIGISHPYTEHGWEFYSVRPALSHFPYLERLFRTQRNSNALMRMARIVVAAERYRLEQGAWPDALPDLVPGYLEALPLDPAGGSFGMTTKDGWLKVFSHIMIVREGEEIPLSVRLPLADSIRSAE